MQCRFCGKECNKPCALVTHERTCVDNPDREKLHSRKAEGWTCCGCNAKFLTRCDLNNHKKDCYDYKIYLSKQVHVRIEFKCSYCNKNWITTTEGFKQHEKYCAKNPDRKIIKENIDLSGYDNRVDTSLEVSDYFKSHGATSIRLYYCKDGRKRVNLYFNNGHPLWLSYARYLWISAYGEIPDGYEVDHINEDRTDDRLENLQLLPSLENKLKYCTLYKKEMVECICPVCGKHFQYEKRNLSTHPNPCCSRKCGGIKSHWK